MKEKNQGKDPNNRQEWLPDGQYNNTNNDAMKGRNIHLSKIKEEDEDDDEDIFQHILPNSKVDDNIEVISGQENLNSSFSEHQSYKSNSEQIPDYDE